MSLQPGQKLLHYDVVAKVGEGGMGEVYRATDTRLGREVAIKTLPPALSGDAERLARFQREAQVLASLNHPNVAAIYGLEEAEQTHFLVLELVEGPDLAERLLQGPVPVAQILEIARQIAEALEAAHEQGVVHRDLKPANVKLTPDGNVKVLDFGLAKALEAGPAGSGDPSLSPTITSAATQAGVILGTAAYMSPEQARGATVDKRSDIWSFGCVLLELLTGRNPFVEDTISDTLASVLRSEPDWKALPADAPPGLRHLLRRCLTRDPRQRLRDIGEARIAIDEIAAGKGTPDVALAAEPAKPARTIGIAVAAALVTALVTVGVFLWLAPTPPEARTLRFEAVTGSFRTEREAPPVLSPDGRKIVFSREGSLWVRHLDQLEPRRLEGTDGAVKPAWSPDSESIAFSDGKDLKTIPAAGGTVSTVAIGVRDVSQAGGIAWGPDGRIAFSTGNAGMAEVAARGGDPKVVLDPNNDTEDDFHGLTFLPDGSILFLVHRSGTGADTLAVFTDGVSRYLFTVESGRIQDPVYSSTGHILYRRVQAKSGLWAVPFSLERLELTGDPFLVAPDASSPSVADDGTLLYVRGDRESLRQLVWVDRDGSIDPTPVGQPMEGIAAPALSPDGTRIAMMASEGETTNIWVYDLERNARSRLTFGGQWDWDPTWTPDGRYVVFWHGDTRAISKTPSDGSGEVERIVRTDLRDSGMPTLSLDGKWMALWILPQGKIGLGDLWYMDLEGNGEPVPIVETDFDESFCALSPDGNFLTYSSDESGTDEVYMTRFPSGEGHWQVSVEGGNQPKWSANGEEIFFVDGTLMKAVRIATGPTVRLGTPETLFDFAGTGIGTEDPRRFEASKDGRRFLMVQEIRDEGAPPSIVLNYNWIE